MKALKFCLTGDFRDILGYSLVFVFFFYLISFACVAPSPSLIGAVAFEICVYFCFLVYRIKRRKAKSVNARKVIADSLIYFLPGSSKIVSVISAFVALLGSFILACAVIDATSFGLALVGQYRAASFMYCRFPASTIAGFDPGYTMELLSGAKMKAGNYDDVERLYRTLLDIRMVYFGARSEKVCEMYADFGDLAEHRAMYQKADEYYVQAIALSKEIKVPQGCGKFLTRLGQMRGEHGQVTEAFQCLNEALSMRSRIFGPNSQKVAETLLVMSKIHSALGDKQTAETLSRKALAILRSHSTETVNLAFYSALFTVLVMAIVYVSTSKKGWLTRFSLVKLQRMISKENVSAVKKEKVLQQLQVLYEYVGDKELSSVHADKKSELTDNLNVAGFLLSLT